MTSIPAEARGAGRSRIHPRRSRNGCLTCKRRKVRCNEERPHCYHCQRLNLECVWKNAGTVERTSPSTQDALSVDLCPAPAAVGTAMEMGVGWLSPSAAVADFAQPSATGPIEDFSLFQDLYLRDFGESIAPRQILQGQTHSTDPGGPSQSPPPLPLTDNTDVDEGLLLHAPPILDPVENGPIGASLRALLDGMATSSPMVRYSMAAFAAVQFHPTGGKIDYQQYYDKASNELEARFQISGESSVSSSELGFVLTTIFFLTYINLLTGRVDLANANLAKAHSALRTSSKGALGSLEQRIISWIRWSDARAALAGGEGLLINDTSGIFPSTPSTTSPSSDVTSPGPPSNSGSYEVVHGMLCQPGIAFFQEVQTITGRITRIAHVHRSRGSVDDETEVMAIAAEIRRDLSSLYDRRPALMDHAASGNIAGVLAEPLASAIVRSFQTYLANFYVCHIHLHRVAHRHLARPEAVTTAVRKIKEITHLMVSSDESIPVNMLWPLFLWGSEEDDQDECQWILETIRSLRHVATNANMAADVLQEIQRRQREAGTRVDIRSVCVELFNATFAII
ncbi:uncharacterized protein DNG_00008 [Cephalotrichum gorgonifer]|uniref:Zn(2)-C6 fungal-type domain-containing protein n=1 Tax=Cephalotrichum gorgonifer TaxID=2041049 RepID=A0AAE8MPK3_9PEZI|nr:uncharacterized protein DNG_00008 [Cephalotrichum gorgonifer]